MMRYYIEDSNKPFEELEIFGTEGVCPEGFREPTLFEKYDMVENSDSWDDFDSSFYDSIIEELSIHFDFNSEEAIWEATWDEVTDAINELKERQEN